MNPKCAPSFDIFAALMQRTLLSMLSHRVGSIQDTSKKKNRNTKVFLFSLWGERWEIMNPKCAPSFDIFAALMQRTLLSMLSHRVGSIQ